MKSHAFSCTCVQILFSYGVSGTNLNRFRAIGNLAKPTSQGGAELVALLQQYCHFKGADLKIEKRVRISSLIGFVPAHWAQIPKNSILPILRQEKKNYDFQVAKIIFFSDFNN